MSSSIESWTTALRASDYEGWVVYVDGAPIFEANTRVPRDLNRSGGLILPYRERDRNAMAWDDLPDHFRIERFELYFGRATWPRHQPIFDVTRVEGSVLRFIQFKRAELVAEAEADVEGTRESGRVTGVQTRTGILAYVVGCYDPAIGATHIFEVDPWRYALSCYGCRKPSDDCLCVPFYHPCWPRPAGLGLAPHVLGLGAADVPPPPAEELLDDGRA